MNKTTKVIHKHFKKVSDEGLGFLNTNMKHAIDELDQLILSILDKCATKIEKETYTENREEDNLVEHIVNEIRKFVIAPKE